MVLKYLSVDGKLCSPKFKLVFLEISIVLTLRRIIRNVIDLKDYNYSSSPVSKNIKTANKYIAISV